MKSIHVCLWGTFLGASPILYKTIKAIILSFLRNRSVDEFPFSAFVEDVERGKIEEVVMKADVFEVFMKASERISTVIQDKLSRIPSYRTRLVPLIDGKDLLALLHRQKVKYGARNPHWAGHAFNAVLAALPFVYLALIWKMLKQAHNPSDSVGKDTIGGEGIPQVTFDEVAGVDHAKAELAEIVDFMRNGSKYTALGARLPKGVLLSGPSGTGKTLLARAVACEAKVPFIACSASDFVEMLVGRGAARVRDLFQRGFASSPCIIFIDELDALAKKRGGLNSNDEREQTLNQLLTEMDGFGTSDAEIVVIAATNRPEVLDDALTRPGRFDRHVHVGLPDQCGRESILKVHLQNVRVGESIIIEELSAKTEGCSGADLANIVNDGALLAVRNGHNNVCMSHLIEAIERNIKSRSYYKSSISSFPDLFEIANR